MRDLHARCIGIAIDADDFYTEALKCNNDFLAQFTAAEQHHAGGGGRKRGTNFHAGILVI